MHNFELAGSIQKTFGSDGELLVEWRAEQAPVANSTFLFIEVNGLRVPFFVKKVEPRATKLLMTLENVETDKMARRLIGKKVLVEHREPENAGATPKVVHSTVEDMAFYHVHDKNRPMGTILQQFDFNGNTCFKIETRDGKQMFIPSHRDLIVKIDRKNRILYMDLPRGF